MPRIVENRRGLQVLLRGPNGGIARDLAVRAVRVQNQAKINATGVPVAGANNPEGRGPRVDFDRLRASIGWEIREEALGLVARVGTNVEYGYYLETGLRNGATYPFLNPALPAARR